MNVRNSSLRCPIPDHLDTRRSARRWRCTASYCQDFSSSYFERQLAVPVFYRDHQVAESRLDLVIDKMLVIELKAVEQVRPVHRAQVVSYLKAGGYELGLLINFNTPRLLDGIQRVVWTL
ncbi:MAG TPA: GxxExxY protein [Kofleriaceae bacterium]|nr:GxxExxY protein [Kofleriaceae bacterium]